MVVKISPQSHTDQWRIQDFPEGGAQTYYLANFSRKMEGNEEILDEGHEGRAIPLRSATADFSADTTKEIHSNSLFVFIGGP